MKFCFKNEINFKKKEKIIHRIRWSELELENRETIEFKFNFEINFPNWLRINDNTIC